MALFGRPVSRLDELRKIVDKDPASRQFLALAEEYRKVGKTREVIDTLERGLRLNAGYVAGHVALGRAYQSLNRLDDAIKAFQGGLKYDRDNLVAIRQLADCYLKKGDKVEAIKKFKLFRGLSPGDKEVSEVIAQLDFELNPPKPQPAPPRPRVETWPNIPLVTKTSSMRRTSTHSGTGAAQPSLTASGRFTIAPRPLGDTPADTTKPIGASAAGQSPRTEPIAPPPLPPPPLMSAPVPPSLTGGAMHPAASPALTPHPPSTPHAPPHPPRPSPVELLEMTFDGSLKRSRPNVEERAVARSEATSLPPEPPTVEMPPVRLSPVIDAPAPLATHRSEISTAPVAPPTAPPPLDEAQAAPPEAEAGVETFARATPVDASGVDELFAGEPEYQAEPEPEPEEHTPRPEAEPIFESAAREPLPAEQEPNEPEPPVAIAAPIEVPPEPPAAEILAGPAPAESPFEVEPATTGPPEEPFEVSPPPSVQEPLVAQIEEPVVSETLAELYRDQGYVEDAKETYRVLAEKEGDEARAEELRERADLITAEAKTPASRLRAFAKKLPPPQDVRLDDMTGVLYSLLERTPGVRAIALTDLEGLPVVTAGDGVESPVLEILIAELTAFCKNLQRSRDDVGSLRSLALFSTEGGALVSGISSEYSLILQLDPGATLGKVRYEAARAANLLRPALG